MRPAHAAQVCGVTLGVIHQRDHGVKHLPTHLTDGPSLMLLRWRCLRLLLVVVAILILVCSCVTRVEVLLVYVNQQVALQRGVVIEAFATYGARIRFLPRVYPDVSHHVVAAVEGLPTLAAVERFLSRVDPHVRLQRARGPETFPANAADFGLHVCFQVSLKTLLGLQMFAAHAADVLGVNFHVIHQRHGGVKGFPTDFTANP